MTRKKEIKAVDLFCGAGGSSSGLAQACDELGLRLQLLAINHWEIAIRTHSTNHPDADHLCTNLDQIDPRKAVPGGRLDLLIASPECVHHSVARGGKPVNDQSRATAWCILRWLGALEVERVLIENVAEFQSWGPLKKKRITRMLKLPAPTMPFDEWIKKTRRFGGTTGEWRRIYNRLSNAPSEVKQSVTLTVLVPDEKKEGEIFLAFIEGIKAHGYNVDWRVLNAADFGDPTSRSRLFIQARRGRKPIRWPEPTHAPAVEEKQSAQPELFSRRLQPYRTAREIIDWTLEGESIFTRKRPLSPNTMARIFKGLEKFCGIPFIIPKEGNGSVRDIDRPLQTITTDARGIGVCQPFLVKYYGGHDAQSVDVPLPTVTANYEHFGVAYPFLIGAGGPQGAGEPRSIDQPLNTILTGDHKAIVQPFFLPLEGFYRGNAPRSIDEPVPTITQRGGGAVIQPYLVTTGGRDTSPRSVDQPVRTLLTREHNALIQPFIVLLRNNQDAQSLDEPLKTICTSGAHHAVCQPYMIELEHSTEGHERRCRLLESPLPTITGRCSFALIQPFFITYHGSHQGREDGNQRVKSVDHPIPTLDCSNRLALVIPQLHPFVVKYNGTGGANSVEEPLDTVTSKDRFGLVEPEVCGEVVGFLDIRFRMLQPHELAAAMSFPKSYVFVGSREQQVRQIGNAVAIRKAKAICKTMLSS